MSNKDDDLVPMLESDKHGNAVDARISISPGLSDWLLAHRVSLAFTSYQSGRLFLCGVAPDGRVAFQEQRYPRVTGLCVSGGSLYVASMFLVWRLENMLRPGEYANAAHDAVFVPRAAFTTNYADIHELGVERTGRLLMVATSLSCLATPHPVHSVAPVWVPPFITTVVPEDRCHLNGLAMDDGVARYVTAAGVSDEKDGWRAGRTASGVLIDLADNRLVAEGLSMPHSPRVYDGAVWLADSGSGWLIRVDPASGALERIALLPGFIRGLAFHQGHALVTTSRARHSSFGDLPLERALTNRGMKAECGVHIVDLANGDVVQSIRFDGDIAELFDIAVLPGVRNPASVGPTTPEMIGALSLGEPAAPLIRA